MNGRPIPKVPILIALAYWEGDRAMAKEVCRICAGLQSEHVGQKASFLLVCRQDCKIDEEMIQIISKKFNLLTLVSNSPLRGWPAGPNGMFGSTMIHVAQGLKGRFECVFWLEADCVPLKPNWFVELSQAWARRPKNVRVIGNRSDCNGDGTGDHISGCSIYDADIAKTMPYLTYCQLGAWDYIHRDKIVQVGQHTNLVRLRYRATVLEPGMIDEPGVAVLHGFKNFDAINAVKKKYGIS